jgi:hypothetical protein
VTGSCGCDCSTGFIGDLCETCVPTTGECLNGGTSFADDGGNCKCECAAGFDGDDCSTELACMCQDTWLWQGTDYHGCTVLVLGQRILSTVSGFFSAVLPVPMLTWMTGAHFVLIMYAVNGWPFLPLKWQIIYVKTR